MADLFNIDKLISENIEKCVGKEIESFDKFNKIEGGVSEEFNQKMIKKIKTKKCSISKIMPICLYMQELFRDTDSSNSWKFIRLSIMSFDWVILQLSPIRLSSFWIMVTESKQEVMQSKHLLCSFVVVRQDICRQKKQKRPVTIVRMYQVVT